MLKPRQLRLLKGSEGRPHAALRVSVHRLLRHAGEDAGVTGAGAGAAPPPGLAPPEVQAPPPRPRLCRVPEHSDGVLNGAGLHAALLQHAAVHVLLQRHLQVAFGFLGCGQERQGNRDMSRDAEFQGDETERKGPSRGEREAGRGLDRNATPSPSPTYWGGPVLPLSPRLTALQPTTQGTPPKPLLSPRLRASHQPWGPGRGQARVGCGISNYTRACLYHLCSEPDLPRPHPCRAHTASLDVRRRPSGLSPGSAPTAARFSGKRAAPAWAQAPPGSGLSLC